VNLLVLPTIVDGYAITVGPFPFFSMGPQTEMNSLQVEKPSGYRKVLSHGTEVGIRLILSLLTTQGRPGSIPAPFQPLPTHSCLNQLTNADVEFNSACLLLIHSQNALEKTLCPEELSNDCGPK
jgi:hypothetical protein